MRRLRSLSRNIRELMSNRVDSVAGTIRTRHEEWTKVCYGESMPTRARLASAPAEYLLAGESWPTGRLAKSAPPEATLAAGIASRMVEAMGGLSIRELARRSDVSPQTVSNLLAGRSWGDLVTLARIERALGVSLWGVEHHAGIIGSPTRGTSMIRPGASNVVQGTAKPARARGAKG
jgi:hypothetical protein